MRRLTVAVMLVVAAKAAHADQVFLRGGGQIAGEIVAERSEAIVVEVGPGRITLPRSAVVRIVRSGSVLGAYRQQASRLAARDVAGWVALAQWAADRDLLTQSREAYEHVIVLDPTNEPAQRGLGRVKLGGRWLTREDAYRAQGLVPFDGRWISPEERALIVEERTVNASALAAQAEAEARVREAEARARAAEAEARRAEAEAQAPADSGNGIPYPWGFGGGPIYPPPVLDSPLIYPPPAAYPPPVIYPPDHDRASAGSRRPAGGWTQRSRRPRSVPVPGPPSPAAGALPDPSRPRH